MMQIFTTAMMSLGIGFLFQVIQNSLETEYLNQYLSTNLITLLIALLAINLTTLGIILTKLKDIIDKTGKNEGFNSTRNEMLLSIKEQIFLIIFSIIFLTLVSSYKIAEYQNIYLLINSIIVGIFVYAIFILYDTAKSIFIILDFKG